MRKIFQGAIVFAVALLAQSCLKDKITKTYPILVPIYKEKAEVYSNIKSNPAREVKAPGKIFLYGNYIFLNEVDKGVHVIDNSDPSIPVVKAFIDIPGNVDMAVKGNTLYADLYTDLVLVDISNPMQAQFIKYVRMFFPKEIILTVLWLTAAGSLLTGYKKTLRLRSGLAPAVFQLSLCYGCHE
ncbi:MAG: hypothetical protein HC867_04190 [Bacteroidia bacterium]|nr:hypothetical protein [Bacteroidia bacterium]